MALVPHRILKSTAICTVFNDLSSGYLITCFINVLAISKRENFFGIFTTQWTIAVVSCNWRSHIVENHNILARHLDLLTLLNK